METCPDCLLEIWNESAGSPDSPGLCECPAIRPQPTGEYDTPLSDEDSEEELEEELCTY